VKIPSSKGQETSTKSLKQNKTKQNKTKQNTFPNLKKMMATNIQEAYKTPNKVEQKRKSSSQNTKCAEQIKILKAVSEKKPSNI
jgi:cytidine deaminase